MFREGLGFRAFFGLQELIRVSTLNPIALR